MSYLPMLGIGGGRPWRLELELGSSTIGSFIEDPGGLLGRTFAVDLADGVFDVGSGIAEPLSSGFSRSVLFEVMGLDGEGLSLRVGVSSASGSELEQGVCFGTVYLQGLDASGAPWFSVDVDDFVFGAWEGALSLLEFSLEGTVAPDGGHVGGVRHSVAVSVDQLGALLGHADASETCAFIEERGVPCEACPDEPARDCMRVAAGGLDALLVPVHLEDVGEVPEDCD